jgi:hypothetical protein
MARWAMKAGIAHPRATGVSSCRTMKMHPSDKGTPTVRSVRKAEGLEIEIAWLPTK